MLTLVLVSNDIPEMQDACEALSLSVEAIGVPDALFVANSSSREVEICCFKKKRDKFEMSHKLESSPPLQGECVFVQSTNYNLIGDVFLRQWFNDFKPAAGCRSRLVRFSCSVGNSPAELKTISEKFSVR